MRRNGFAVPGCGMGRCGADGDKLETLDSSSPIEISDTASVDDAVPVMICAMLARGLKEPMERFLGIEAGTKRALSEATDDLRWAGIDITFSSTLPRDAKSLNDEDGDVATLDDADSDVFSCFSASHAVHIRVWAM